MTSLLFALQALVNSSLQEKWCIVVLHCFYAGLWVRILIWSPLVLFLLSYNQKYKEQHLLRSFPFDAVMTVGRKKTTMAESRSSSHSVSLTTSLWKKLLLLISFVMISIVYKKIKSWLAEMPASNKLFQRRVHCQCSRE